MTELKFKLQSVEFQNLDLILFPVCHTDSVFMQYLNQIFKLENIRQLLLPVKI